MATSAQLYIMFQTYSVMASREALFPTLVAGVILFQNTLGYMQQ